MASVWRARGWCLVVCWLAFAAAGCDMPRMEEGGGTGPGGRPQPLALSPQQELQVGRRAYREVLEQYHDRLLPRDDPEVLRARRVTARIIQAARIEPLQREIKLRIRGYVFEWDVNVVRSSTVNAFCLPGGKIVLYTGIMKVTEGNDDQLAAVIAHEVSHALAHHASERLAREQRSGGRDVLGKLKYERDQESEADHIGVFLMTFAGYDPEAAVRFWERMQQLHKGGGRPEILSDHPSDARRIHDLQKWVPAARAAWQAYQDGNIAPAPRW